eukprot:Em0007g248a
MIKATDLQQVQLKSRDESSRRDRSAPNFNIGSEFSKQREETLRDYFFSTGLDRWSSSSDGDAELPTFEVPASLIGLRKRIDDVIGSLSPEAGVFVKLTTRSPKDSHVAFAKARRAFVSKLPSLGDNPSANNRLILLAEVVIQSLRVRSGEEAISLLVSSTRVGEDLDYALNPENDDFEKCTCLVVRKWVDIPLWAEFRGFVWDGKLTSIGQYNHPVRFPQLIEHKERIRWSSQASTGLWSWMDDREHMMKGALELRIREAELEAKALKSSIEPEWRSVVFPSAMATH